MKLMHIVDRKIQDTAVDVNADTSAAAGASSFDEARESYDVVIVGLGTAGAIAVTVAASRGLRVLGIDRHNCMGGTGTAGGVLGYYFGSQGGLYEQLDRQSAEAAKGVYTPPSTGEGKQVVLEREALRAGATVRYNTTVTGVYMDGKTVKGLQCFSPKRGLYSVFADVIVDCTGNADVCRLAGCEFMGGRAFDGQPQPYSNVLFLQEPTRVRTFYTDSGYVNPEDPDDMSRAIVESALLSTHLREKYDEDRRLLRIASLLGVREGPRIVGEENITLERFLNGDYSREPLFYAYSNLDNHSKDVAFESELQQDWTVAASLWGLKFSVPVPLGALIPKGYDGLIVAGRCLAVDHDLAACVRMKRDMQQCGEAAANAAYLAVTRQIPLREVPYAELAALQKASGVLSENSRVFFEIRLAEGDTSNPLVTWLEDVGRIKAGLASEKPGVAIWSARRLGEAIRPHLREWLRESGNEHLRKHSAIALALMNAPEAAPVLREIVREKDPFVPKTSLKYNQARGYAAIYLLGKLRDKEAVADLIGVLETADSFTFIDSNREFLSDEKDLRFQYVSYTVMALSRIGDRHPETRPAIRAALEKYLARLDGSLVISFKGSSEIRLVMDDKIRQAANQAFERWAMAEQPA